MSDEVKMAADRLRLVNIGESPLSIYGQFWSEEIAGDYAVVANAYLAEHANDADNATLLTDEILRAIGWTVSRDKDDNIFAQINSLTWLMRGEFDKHWLFRDGPGRVETVGDLRKLLEALHIPAVVVVPNGGESATLQVLLTEEVLERNGWSEFRGTWHKNLQFGLQFYSDDLGSCWNVVGDENPDVVVGSILTVSDLRRLLDVFGIQEDVI